MGNGCVKGAAVAAAAPVVLVVGTGVVLGAAAAGAMGVASAHVGTDGGKDSMNDPKMQRRMVLEQQKNAYHIKKKMREEVAVAEHHHVAEPDVNFADTEQYRLEREAFAKVEAKMAMEEASKRAHSTCNVCGKDRARGLCVCRPARYQGPAGRKQDASVRRTKSDESQGARLERARSEAPRRTKSQETQLPPIRGGTPKVKRDGFGRPILTEPPAPRVHLARATSEGKPSMESYLGESIVTREVTEKLRFLGTPKPIFTHQDSKYPKPHLSSWDG